MLISISEALETSVSTLLGDTIAEETPNDIRVLSEKLEVINLQMARKKATRQRIIHWCFISLCAIVVVIFALLVAFQSSYLEWDYTSPETAVIGVGIHSLEFKGKVMSKKNKKHRRKEETFSEGYLEDWDDTYACIVGYTSCGAAYGLTWEQM